MSLSAVQEQIVRRAVQDITGMKYFYSQDDSLCHGALDHACRYLNVPNNLAQGLVPHLREALQKVQENF